MKRQGSCEAGVHPLKGGVHGRHGGEWIFDLVIGTVRAARHIGDLERNDCPADWRLLDFAFVEPTIRPDPAIGRPRPVPRLRVVSAQLSSGWRLSVIALTRMVSTNR